MTKKRIISAMLGLTLVVLTATGCSGNIKSDDIMADIKANPVEAIQVSNKNVKGTEFAVEMLKRTSNNNENTIISPMSAMIALSIAANGADGTTKDEMLNLLFEGSSVSDINKFWYSYIKDLPDDEGNKLTVANSIWIRDDGNKFTPDMDFLQTNADYYSSSIYKSPFDETTVKDINNWVKKNTDGQIEKIVDKIAENNIMSIINAVTFDAKWESTYETTDVIDDTFTNYDGTKSDVKLMFSNEMYIESSDATGIVKNYKNGYQFVAVLPDEDISLNDYIENLDDDKITELLDSIDEDNIAHAYLPKFTTEFSVDLNKALTDMGIATAFDVKKADFSKLGYSDYGNIYISSVTQDTCISVDELGTKAAAATKIDFDCGSALLPEKEIKLNRPFMYMIIDNTVQLPVFMGTINMF